MTKPWDPNRTRNNLARLLREIEDLDSVLEAQALANHDDEDFPGGRALNALGPAAIPQDWEAVYDRLDTEAHDNGRPLKGWDDPVVYQTALEETPLIVLGYWTRTIRLELQQPTGLKPTVGRELGYLSGKLDLLTATEDETPIWPAIDRLEADLTDLVRRLENLLKAGDRIDASAAACFQTNDDHESGMCEGRLVRVNFRPDACIHSRLGSGLLARHPDLAEAHKSCDQGGRDDVYRCQTCEKRYTSTEYWLAVREHYERAAKPSALVRTVEPWSAGASQTKSPSTSDDPKRPSGTGPTPDSSRPPATAEPAVS